MLLFRPWVPAVARVTFCGFYRPCSGADISTLMLLKLLTFLAVAGITVVFWLLDHVDDIPAVAGIPGNLPAGANVFAVSVVSALTVVLTNQTFHLTNCCTAAVLTSNFHL